MSSINEIKDRLLSKEIYYINKYMLFLRKEENCRKSSNPLIRRLRYIYQKRKNQLGIRLGFVIPAGTLGEGVEICHIGNIIINGNSKVGKGTKFHGSNCLGNDGKTEKAPRIGEYVDIGFGAVIIGDIEIADYCRIGAGAVVTRSCRTPGKTLAGIPAEQRE